MKYKTSFFNKGVLLSDLKRFGWLGIVYFFILFFNVPLKIIMINSNNTYDYTRSMDFIFNFSRSSEIQKYLLVVFPVLTAIFLFRYIHSKRSVDMIHCLPLKREKLYDNHVLIGLLFLVLPVIITALISWLLKVVLNLNDLNIHYSVEDILIWAGITIILNITIFLFSVLMAMLTGLSTAQGILTYIFLFIPCGLGLLLLSNLNLFVYGFDIKYALETKISNFSPLMRILELGQRVYDSRDHYFYQTIHFSELIIYIIFSIIIYFLARYVYMKRSLEGASKAVAFIKLQPVFKYGVTFCCMLVGGMYFGETQHSIYWILFGYIAASLIGYFIAEMVIKKSFMVFRNLKGYFVFAGIITVLLIGINFDITGYENRIPSLEDVESVYCDNGFYLLRDIDNPYRETPFYSQKEDISNIVKFHKDIIDNKKNIKYHYKNPTENASFLYNLKNGKQLKREFSVSIDMYDKYFKPIYESKEYKKMHNDIFNITYTNIDKITISSNNLNKKTVIVDPSEIKEALKILQNEKINESYEESKKSYNIRDWGDISILLSDDTVLSDDKKIHLGWEKHYTEFEEWLSKKDYLKTSRVLPEDISYAVVEKISKNKNTSRIINLKDKTIKRLDIYDKDKIEVCLRNCCNWSDSEYIIGFYCENGNYFDGRFKEKYVPDFVKEYFENN